MNFIINIKKAYQDLLRRIEEIAYFTNRAKNAISIYLGDFTALTYIYNGTKIYVDTRDISVAPHILLTGEWEMDVTHHWMKALNEIQPKQVFDLGSNTGYFGLLALANSEAPNVHFFEANPRLCDLLKKTVAVNGYYDRSTIINKGVSNLSDQDIMLTIPGDYFGSASLHEGLGKVIESRTDIKSATNINIKTLTIDDYCEQLKIVPELIKMDVEGFEYNVLLGAINTIHNKSFRKLFLEYTPGAYPKQIFELFTQNFSRIEKINGYSTVVIDDLSKLDEIGDWSMLILTKI
jgi:FkbM family methyltransferase